MVWSFLVSARRLFVAPFSLNFNCINVAMPASIANYWHNEQKRKEKGNEAQKHRENDN